MGQLMDLCVSDDTTRPAWGGGCGQGGNQRLDQEQQPCAC